MANEIVGVVDAVLDKKTAKGEAYRVVRIAGEGFFDWHRHVSKANVTTGDSVRLTVEPGRFPRVKSLHKVSGAGPEPSPAPNGNGSSGNDADSELQLRAYALALAAELRRESVVSLAQQKADVVELAEALLTWLCKARPNRDNHEADPFTEGKSINVGATKN